MDLKDFRGVIFHQAAQGRSAKDIYLELQQDHAHRAPPYPTVVRWCQEFRFGRTDLANRASTGRPLEVATQHKIGQARKLVAENRSISVRSVARELQLAQ